MYKLMYKELVFNQPHNYRPIILLNCLNLICILTNKCYLLLKKKRWTCKIFIIHNL